MADTRDALDDVIVELYRLPPAQFTAARTERAAAASGEDAQRITALRKPVVAAWAVNLLVADGQLAEAVELASALRDAQDDLDAAELRQLGAQRRQLVASLARRAEALVEAAGGTLSAAARDAVAGTINAAVVDERAAAIVLTGRVIKPVDAAELDDLDVSQVVAGSPPNGVPERPAQKSDDLAERRARKAAERTAREAEQAASEAERGLARIEARRGKAAERADLLRERAEGLRAELARVEADADQADAELERLDDERRDAASAAADATRAAERARDAVPGGAPQP